MLSLNDGCSVKNMDNDKKNILVYRNKKYQYRKALKNLLVYEEKNKSNANGVLH